MQQPQNFWKGTGKSNHGVTKTPYRKTAGYGKRNIHDGEPSRKGI